MNLPQQLCAGVFHAYSAVAEQPEAEHPFAVGKQFAAGLGYPMDLLERLPPASVQAFTGVSNVSIFADLPSGARVLDLGCGAGMDALIAAERVGPTGQVMAVDFSPAMLARAQCAASQASLANIHHRPGSGGRFASKKCFGRCGFSERPVQSEPGACGYFSGTGAPGPARRPRVCGRVHSS